MSVFCNLCKEQITGGNIAPGHYYVQFKGVDKNGAPLIDFEALHSDDPIMCAVCIQKYSGK